LRDGLPLTLSYEDPLEEWEVDAVLAHVAEPGFDDMWMAMSDWTTFRRVRG
jgi:hypothetical protein